MGKIADLIKSASFLDDLGVADQWYDNNYANAVDRRMQDSLPSWVSPLINGNETLRNYVHDPANMNTLMTFNNAMRSTRSLLNGMGTSPSLPVPLSQGDINARRGQFQKA